MKLSETRYDNRETQCCARLDVGAYHDRRIEWHDKPFVKDHIRAILRVPTNMGAVMSRDIQAIEAAEAWPEEPIWLTDEISPWGSDIYTAVDGDVPGMEKVTLSGTFLTKVYDGPYRDIGKWTADMERHVANQGETLKHLYYYYGACPRCAKSFGHNYVVLFAQVQ